MTQWHPAHDARELEPGVWQLAITAGRDGEPGYAQWPFAEIRFMRLGEEQGYRAVIWDETHPRELVGYYRSLRGACLAAYRDRDRLRRAKVPGRDPLTGGVVDADGQLFGGPYETPKQRAKRQA